MPELHERMDMTEGTVKARVAVKATATATEAGAFTAIAAAYTIDRDKEFIRPGAFKNTIEAWQGRDRPIPLHWAHKGEPENIIGSIDPHTMAETDDGLYVEGQLDLKQSGNAGEAWRLVKAGVVGLSFGFLGTMGEKQQDGTREIVDVDVFEVSLTPAPANPDTKILSWKSITPDAETLRKQSQAVERQLIEETLPEPKLPEPVPVEEPAPPVEEPEPVPAAATLKKESQAVARQLVAETLPTPKASESPQEPAVDVEALQAEKDALQAKVEALTAEPEKSAEELKKESVEVSRGLIKDSLPEPAPESPPEPDPEMEMLKARIEALEAEPEKTAEELKKESAKVERQLIEADLPEPAVPEPEPTIKELQALLVEKAEQMHNTQQRHLGMLAAFAGIKELPDDVKESLTDSERQILDAAVEKKADETARGRKARSVDPLLKEAQKAELDRLVGRRDLPKPPEPEPEPEPLDAKRLRKDSRETMLALLTGASNGSDTE